MITSLSLLSLALVASPITISEVTSARDGGRLVIDITGDAMVDPELATAKLGTGVLYLNVRETRVRANNRAWGEGDSQIRAHRHRERIELVVPLPDDGSCRGPVEFAKAAGGLRASVGCEGGAVAIPAPKAEPVARPAAKIVAEVKAAPEPPAPKAPKIETPPAMPTVIEPMPSLAAVKVMKSTPEAEQLKAMLALVDVPASAPVTTPAAKAEVPMPPALVAINIDDKPAPSAKEATAPVTKPAPTPEAAKAQVPTAGAVTEKPASSGGGGGLVLAVILLIGLAGSAYYFSRRRGTVTRFINIVETANLGPKRSLIVARIGDETLFLGSSEAGITLLKAHTESKADMAAAAAPTTARTGDPVADAWFETPVVAEAPVVDNVVREEFPIARAQGGLLARLFNRARPANEAELEDVNFDVFLEDSIEDQELRRKLSMGMAGRVA